MEDDELKSCPFCGKKGTLVGFKGMIGEKRWYVHCKNSACKMKNVETYRYDNKNLAIVAWNRRVK